MSEPAKDLKGIDQIPSLSLEMKKKTKFIRNILLLTVHNCRCLTTLCSEC